MASNITHERKENWWNGEVVIDELKVYADNRGMVCETFRDDDNDLISSKMCYISETSPFVMRGPHEHAEQTDSFVTWKSRMIYHMYNPKTNEMKYYVTNPEKITRVIVKPGIVHSYRNIDIRSANTLNFPDQLFMGKDKKGYKPDLKIDEIRHEEKIQPKNTIWVLGAGGRLGAAIVDKLFQEMKYHTYHVVPVYEKIQHNAEGMQNLKNIFTAIEKHRTSPNDIIINCIAKTNVQLSNANSEFLFSNFLLPKYIAEWAVTQKFKFVHFSTDYVFQEGELSDYTKSKRMWENWFQESQFIKNEQNFCEYGEDATQYIKVIRVANLFSSSPLDTHNIINKIVPRFKDGKIKTVKDLKIMPTDVSVVAEFIAKEYLPKIEEYTQIINVSGKAYTIEELHENIYKSVIADSSVQVFYDESPTVISHPEMFLEKHYIELNNDHSIISKIKSLV